MFPAAFVVRLTVASLGRSLTLASAMASPVGDVDARLRAVGRFLLRRKTSVRNLAEELTAEEHGL